MSDSSLSSIGFTERADDLLFGLFEDNTETKGMTHDELIAHCKSKGVIIKTSTKNEES